MRGLGRIMTYRGLGLNVLCVLEARYILPMLTIRLLCLYVVQYGVFMLGLMIRIMMRILILHCCRLMNLIFST